MWLQSTLLFVPLAERACSSPAPPPKKNEHENLCQVAVIDCLEDPDDTLKLKTLELLATMTKANNVQVR